MITKYQVVLKTGDEFKFSSNMASLMHGAIMDYLDKEYIEKIHEQEIRPFSQSIFKNSEGEWIWEVNCLNKEADENIISRLCIQNSIYIKHKDINIDISEYKIKNTDYNQLRLSTNPILNSVWGKFLAYIQIKYSETLNIHKKMTALSIMKGKFFQIHARKFKLDPFCYLAKRKDIRQHASVAFYAVKSTEAKPL